MEKCCQYKSVKDLCYFSNIITYNFQIVSLGIAIENIVVGTTSSFAVRVVHFRLEALFVFMSFPFTLKVLRLWLMVPVLALLRRVSGLAAIGLRCRTRQTSLLYEVVIGGLDCGVSQHILDKVGGVLLQQHLVPLLEDFKHVVVKVLVQGDVLVVLVVRVVDAHAPRVARPQAIVVVPIVQEFAASSSSSEADGAAGLDARLLGVMMVAGLTSLVLT